MSDPQSPSRLGPGERRAQRCQVACPRPCRHHALLCSPRCPGRYGTGPLMAAWRPHGYLGVFGEGLRECLLWRRTRASSSPASFPQTGGPKRTGSGMSGRLCGGEVCPADAGRCSPDAAGTTDGGPGAPLRRLSFQKRSRAPAVEGHEAGTHEARAALEMLGGFLGAGAGARKRLPSCLWEPEARDAACRQHCGSWSRSWKEDSFPQGGSQPGVCSEGKGQRHPGLIRVQRGAQSCWSRHEFRLGVCESWQNQTVGLEQDGSSFVAPKMWVIGHFVRFDQCMPLGISLSSSLNLNLQYGEAADGDSSANWVSTAHLGTAVTLRVGLSARRRKPLGVGLAVIPVRVTVVRRKAVAVRMGGGAGVRMFVLEKSARLGNGGRRKRGTQGWMAR